MPIPSLRLVTHEVFVRCNQTGAMPGTDDLPEQSRIGIGFLFGALQADAIPGPVLVQLVDMLELTEPATRHCSPECCARAS